MQTLAGQESGGRDGYRQERNIGAPSSQTRKVQCANSMLISRWTFGVKVRMPYPSKLVRFSKLVRLLAHAIWVPEDPDGKLMQDPELCEEIEVVEFDWLVLVAKRIRVW